LAFIKEYNTVNGPLNVKYKMHQFRFQLQAVSLHLVHLVV